MGLWQKQDGGNSPIEFWSQLWKGVEACYFLIEKQFVATYAALLACEPITGTESVMVRTIYPIDG